MSYITVADDVTKEIVIEKSRFIAHVIPVSDEETAKQRLEIITKEYWDATHNCYAYVIGEDQQHQKANDDGEPSGTAGIPILELIKKNGLTDTLIVVTRYFGGVKLGAGGLVRAYTRSASEGLQQAQLLRQEMHLFFELIIEYAAWDRIQQPLHAMGFVHDKTFTDKVKVTFSIPEEKKTELIRFLQKWGDLIHYRQTIRDRVPVPL